MLTTDRRVEGVEQMSEYTDELVGYVEWAPNRQVLVFKRAYGDRAFVRTRVFNRHKQHGFWYPSPRSFHVNQDCAEELGEAISCAGRGEPYCPDPDWRPEFAEQYASKGKTHVAKWKREPGERKAG